VGSGWQWSDAGACGEVGRAGPQASARERDGGDLGRNQPNRGREKFLFFSFSISESISLSPFFIISFSFNQIFG
jgi:hypothetical protein